MPPQLTKRISYQEAPLELCSVRLPFWHIQTAKKLGGGNISAGIRIALEASKSIRKLDELKCIDTSTVQSTK